MTNEERHTEIGRVVSELAEARRHHSCLTAKAVRLSCELQEVAALLHNGPPRGTVNSGADGVFNIAAGMERHEYRLPPCGEVVRLVEDINKVQGEIRQLERQRQAFGID